MVIRVLGDEVETEGLLLAEFEELHAGAVGGGLADEFPYLLYAGVDLYVDPVGLL